MILGLNVGCRQACNQTFQEKPVCYHGCLKSSQKFKETAIEELGNVSPPHIKTSTSFSQDLEFSKVYLEKLRTAFPDVPFGKLFKENMLERLGSAQFFQGF